MQLSWAFIPGFTGLESLRGVSVNGRFNLSAQHHDEHVSRVPVSCRSSAWCVIDTNRRRMLKNVGRNNGLRNRSDGFSFTTGTVGHNTGTQ